MCSISHFNIVLFCFYYMKFIMLTINNYSYFSMFKVTTPERRVSVKNVPELVGVVFVKVTTPLYPLIGITYWEGGRRGGGGGGKSWWQYLLNTRDKRKVFWESYCWWVGIFKNSLWEFDGREGRPNLWPGPWDGLAWIGSYERVFPSLFQTEYISYLL